MLHYFEQHAHPKTEFTKGSDDAIMIRISVITTMYAKRQLSKRGYLNSVSFRILRVYLLFENFSFSFSLKKKKRKNFREIPPKFSKKLLACCIKV